MTNTAIILLAAGFSHRMGSVNKLLLPFDGVALLRRTAEMLASLPHVSVNVVWVMTHKRLSKLLQVLTLSTPSIQTMQRA